MADRDIMDDHPIPAEDGPTDAETARWQQENRSAMDAWNDYVELHGVPFRRFRQP